jgi:hypothetical protein
MTARFLPLSLLLLLSRAVPAHADLKIVTHESNCSSTTTRYVQGRNVRIDTHFANFPQQIVIFDADHQRSYTLDPASRAYAVRPVEPWKPDPLLRVPESGKTIDIYRDYVDTGERRWMFGHLARHVIQSERRVPEPGSCSAGEGERRIKTDGWYIDLPAAYPQGHGYVMDGGAVCPNGALDRTEIHTTGHCENGFPLLETVTALPRNGFTSRTKVIELHESPLDPKTFMPPADFHQVPSLPQDGTSTFLDTLEYRWSRLVCNTWAEALLE